MNCFKCCFFLGFFLACSGIGQSAEPLKNLVMNGAFEAGNQYWKGDGKVVTLPDGNKVYQLEATANRPRIMAQDFRMHGLKEVEVVFRARSVGYKGAGLRVALHRPGAGFEFFDEEAPGGNVWTEYRIQYLQTASEDQRTLVISLHEGSGSVQIDDIEVGAPGTLAKGAPPKPVVPPKPEAAKSAPAPAKTPTAPAAIVAAVVSKPLPAGDIVSLEDVLDSVPADILLKFKDLATQEDAVKEMNSYFSKQVKGKPARMKVTVEKGSDFEGATTKYYRLKMPDDAMGNNQAGIKRQTFFVYIPKKNLEDENAVVAPGTKVTVSGDFTRCDIKNADGWRLFVNLTGGRIEP